MHRIGYLSSRHLLTCWPHTCMSRATQVIYSNPPQNSIIFIPKPPSMETAEPAQTNPSTDKDVKAPNLLERAKEEIEAIMHHEKSHDKETHGKSDDIDVDTPIEKIKGPNIFERAKEEIEALIEVVHPKKESNHESPSKK